MIKQHDSAVCVGTDSPVVVIISKGPPEHGQLPLPMVEGVSDSTFVAVAEIQEGICSVLFGVAFLAALVIMAGMFGLVISSIARDPSSQFGGNESAAPADFQPTDLDGLFGQNHSTPAATQTASNFTLYK